jgi:hypothetical protein
MAIAGLIDRKSAPPPVYYQMKKRQRRNTGEDTKECAKIKIAEEVASLGFPIKPENVQIVTCPPPDIQRAIIFKPSSNGSPQLFHPISLLV